MARQKIVSAGCAVAEMKIAEEESCGPSRFAGGLAQTPPDLSCRTRDARSALRSSEEDQSRRARARIGHRAAQSRRPGAAEVARKFLIRMAYTFRPSLLA